jgi:hypothetical protein
MVRVKFEKKSAGPVASEALVEIPTVTGNVEVVVHTSQVDNEGVEAGWIGKSGDKVLVELPRETMSGEWRVWVPEKAVKTA